MPVGTVTTYDIAAGRKRYDVEEEIVTLFPNATPFAVIAMRGKRKTVHSEKWSWFDDEPESPWTKINHGGGYAAGDTALVVDDATFCLAKDVLRVSSTGEQLYVLDRHLDTNTIDVVRGYGTTEADDIADDADIVNLSNAMEENSTAPESRKAQPTEKWNVVQEMRTPVRGSLKSEVISLATNMKERQRLRRRAQFAHRLKIERQLLLGERKEDTDRMVSVAAGALYFIETNIYDLNGAMLTEAEFEEFCEMAFAYGPGPKLLIACPRIMTVINQFSAGKLTTHVGQDTYGVTITNYKSAHGTLELVESKTFERGYNGMGICVDLDEIAYRPLVGCDTKLDTDLQPKDQHGWLDELWTVCGFQLRNEKYHSVLKGVPAA